MGLGLLLVNISRHNMLANYGNFITNGSRCKSMFQIVFMIFGLEGLLLAGLMISSAPNVADEECGQSRKVCSAIFLRFILLLSFFHLLLLCRHPLKPFFSMSANLIKMRYYLNLLPGYTLIEMSEVLLEAIEWQRQHCHPLYTFSSVGYLKNPQQLASSNGYKMDNKVKK